MEILNYVFTISIIIWLCSEIYYKRILKSGNDAEKKDRSTLNILWVVIVPSVALGVSISKITSFTMVKENWIYYFGLALIICGVFFRWIIIRSLGKYFTVDVSIRNDHQIKKDGLYKYLRHPSYTFALLTFLGLAFYLNNWISFFIVFVPVFIVFRYRIKVEELALIERFGDEYLKYRKETKMLIPFMY